MKYKVKHLKKVFALLVDKYFPQELDSYQTYKVTFDFAPCDEESCLIDNVSLKISEKHMIDNPTLKSADIL